MRTRSIAALSRGEPVAREEVVVFHQHHVEEPEAMIRPAARNDRRFLKLPQARRRLARVENLRAMGAGGFDELMSQGRDPAEVAGGN